MYICIPGCGRTGQVAVTSQTLPKSSPITCFRYMECALGVKKWTKYIHTHIYTYTHNTYTYILSTKGPPAGYRKGTNLCLYICDIHMVIQTHTCVNTDSSPKRTCTHILAYAHITHIYVRHADAAYRWLGGSDGGRWGNMRRWRRQFCVHPSTLTLG